MLKKPVFSPTQPLRAETRFSRASFSPRKHPQRSPEATPPVLPSAAALLAGFLSILRNKPERLDIQTNRARLASLVRLSASNFIHVDDFCGLPQILLFRIGQRLYPIFFRLFTKLSRSCRHSRFLFGRRQVRLWWRRLPSSLLGRIHINGHGNSAVICVQFPPDPLRKSMRTVAAAGVGLSLLAGCSKRLFSKTAASKGLRRTLRGARCDE